MITRSMKLTEHFHSSEFKCPCCNKIYIDRELVNKMENIFSKLNASKCIISSGYRCKSYDIKIGGFAGRHSEGLAADSCYYDKNGNIIPSKYVVCAAFDLKELNGIAKINDNYVHLDNRKGSAYYGDETRGNSSYWSDPYAYFNVERKIDKDINTLAKEVIEGLYGNGEERKKKLGSKYDEVQKEVNRLLNKGLLKLVVNTINGVYGNGEERKQKLGSRYEEVQTQVNKNIQDGNYTEDRIHLY